MIKNCSVEIYLNMHMWEDCGANVCGGVLVLFFLVVMCCYNNFFIEKFKVYTKNA